MYTSTHPGWAAPDSIGAKRRHRCWQDSAQQDLLLPPLAACLVTLPNDLLISILKQLPLETKCKAQAVCQTFKNILWKPSQGSFVWDSIQLDNPIFESASPTALARQVFPLVLLQICHGRYFKFKVKKKQVCKQRACQ